VGLDLDLDAEQRRADGVAEELLVALVVGVGDEGDASRDQLGPGGLDVDGVAVGQAERDAVVGTGHLAILELGLGDGRAEVDVPEDRSVGLVGLAAGEVAQEGALGDLARALPDGGVGHVPVDRQAEGPPEVLEGLLVDGGEAAAQLDEVAP